MNIHFIEMLMDLYKCVFYATDFDVDPSYELVDVGTKGFKRSNKRYLCLPSWKENVAALTLCIVCVATVHLYKRMIEIKQK